MSILPLLKFIKKYPKQADYILLVLGFSLGANFFVFLKLSGISKIAEIQQSLYHFHWSNPTLAGLLIGLTLSFFELQVFEKYFLRLKMYQLVVIRILAFCLCTFSSISLVHVVTDMLIYKVGFQEALYHLWQFFQSGIFAALFVYLIFLGFSLNFIRAIGNRFGHGILANYLLGKYRLPLEENRLFMFLDLNGSTRLAEELGPTKYSRLLNKCFSQLSALLVKYDAELYQFVGDEAVITWKMKTVKNPLAPIELFFDFKNLLFKNRDEFEEKFGVLPSFKSSINSGVVVVTELGIHRKEIAYHGDVLNTGARVLELASRLKKSLLITEKIKKCLPSNTDFQCKFIADIPLRGKKDLTPVYEVKITNTSNKPLIQQG